MGGRICSIAALAVLTWFIWKNSMTSTFYLFFYFVEKRFGAILFTDVPNELSTVGLFFYIINQHQGCRIEPGRRQYGRHPQQTPVWKINSNEQNLKLTDLYRFLYPNKTKFSYIPAKVANTNRSRLDFFLISESLLPWVGDCCIANSLSSTNFDRKPISLYLNKKN